MSDSPHDRAEALAHQALLVDTHIDLPHRMLQYRRREGRDLDVSRATEGGHFDYPRAVAGGLDVAFMAVYVPAEVPEDEARGYADRLVDLVEALPQRWPERFALVRSPAEARQAVGSGRMALPLAMENGTPIGSDLANLRHFFDRGIRYLTLAHSAGNQLSDSSFDATRRWHGLSPFGRQVVKEMNRLGMMVDVSHLSDAAFDQVLEVSRAPVIASHSSCRHFTPGFERNLSDEMIRRLAALGGLVQINFGSAFLTAEAHRQFEDIWSGLVRFLRERQLALGSPETDVWLEDYFAEHPRVETSVADVADHIERVIALGGIEHVGIGSDFDGVPAVPVGLEDVAGYPALVAELLRRGHSEADLRKVLGENLMRVWAQAEAEAGPVS
jgi:membrane dipeptidase